MKKRKTMSKKKIEKLENLGLAIFLVLYLSLIAYLAIHK